MSKGDDDLRSALTPLVNEQRALGEWKPQQAGLRDKQAELLKDYAAAVRDWDLLDRAVEQEISDQRNLVQWWDENVQKGRPKKSFSGSEKLFGREDAERVSGLPDGKVSKWRKALRGDLERYAERLRDPSWRKAMGERGSTDEKGASGKGEDEWHTPAEFVELVREVFNGEIGLDPATSHAAQEVVQANAFYTKAENGLIHDWSGRVFLNPPYSKELIGQFIDKLSDEWRLGHISEAIVLTHNYTDTGWFHKIFQNYSAICFKRLRVEFVDPDGEKCNPTQGQAFTYFGSNIDHFADVFKAIGAIAVPFARID